MAAIWQPSPNFGEDRETTDFIILHGTWMADDQAALARLCDKAPPPELGRVSAHYFIDQQGKLYQMVKEEHVAWHAGISEWQDVVGLNRHSIGIEISNPGIQNPEEEGFVPYHDCQYETLNELLAGIVDRHSIPRANILSHQQIAPDRKDDPGSHFDWERVII